MLETKLIREPTIQLHNLENMDDKMYFYYDESNNFRKVRFKSNKLNVPIDSNFVLGGVVHEENSIDFDYMKLCDELNLQKTVSELKLKNIATGDFWNCLNSNRMTTFLDWLYESDLYIHYYVMNLFYFSIVDIVDSVITTTDDAMKLGMDFVNNIKSDLYTIAKLDENKFISLLIKYDYPNIKSTNIADFIEDLTSYINNFNHMPNIRNNLMLLTQLLKTAKNKNELVFLEHNTDHLLIEDFAHFYLQPIYMFINSTHEFDNESTVFNIISEINAKYDSLPLSNYFQSDSKSSKLIQISDIVVGLLAKLTNIVVASTFDDLVSSIGTLNRVQAENYKKFIAIVDKSNEFNKALLKFSMADEDRKKLAWLGL